MKQLDRKRRRTTESEREKEGKSEKERERDKYLPLRLIKGSFSFLKIHLFALSTEGTIIITFAP